ncbi:MAG: hypothetical protein FWC87_09640, partial [Acidimicrobiaceae bacterium]|nr:hypothetical protein [Acidimicrobiaceae bacterium]
FTVTSVGFPTPTLSEGGGLPAGVRFTDHGDGTATLAGTPAAGTARVYHLMITAQNGVSPAATQAFTLTVNPPPGFHREPGSATDVGVGANGSVWVVGTNAVPGGFGIWRFAGTGWVAVPGGGVSIAVDPAGNPWVTNSLHQIWRWTGHAFVHVPGQATDVGVGADGSVWVVGTNPAPGGFGISQITAAGTVPVAGGAVSISVDPAGNPWVTNSLHQIWRWTGHAFVRVAGSATDIGVGANSAAWTVGTNPTPGGFGISQITTTGHQPVSGGAIRIAVNPAGNPWVTNSLSQIFSFH